MLFVIASVTDGYRRGVYGLALSKTWFCYGDKGGSPHLGVGEPTMLFQTEGCTAVAFGARFYNASDLVNVTSLVGRCAFCARAATFRIVQHKGSVHGCGNFGTD
eukprot:2587402-Rhodomonas_salina.1